MYQKQTADVRWEGIFAKECRMTNGVKQGTIPSPILFCFYMNNLSGIMTKKRTDYLTPGGMLSGPNIRDRLHNSGGIFNSLNIRDRLPGGMTD